MEIGRPFGLRAAAPTQRGLRTQDPLRWRTTRVADEREGGLSGDGSGGEGGVVEVVEAQCCVIQQADGGGGE